MAERSTVTFRHAVRSLIRSELQVTTGAEVAPPLTDSALPL